MRHVSILSILLLAAFALIAAQCGGGDNGEPLTSGIEGLVTIGPMCPVEQIDTPCPDQPYQATLVVTDLQGDEVARTESGEDGRYRFELAPGTYTLVPWSPSQGGMPSAPERQVEVREGLFTTADVQYDSGIR